MMRRAHTITLAILGLGALARIWLWAQGRSLWLDEEMIAGNIRSRDLGDLIGRLTDEQAAPLGWLWLERIVFAVAGGDERALRLQALLAGLGTLAVAGWVGRRWLGGAGAIALATLCAFSHTLLTYSAELKHYSSDAFFVFLMAAMTIWALEQPASWRRHLAWWAVALAGSWLSIGAILAAPGLALVLVIGAWRKAGWGATVRAAAPGLVWAAAFLAHYVLTLRANATGNDYMAQIWASGFPPPGADPLRTVVWLVQQLKPLSANPLHLRADPIPYALATGVAAAFWVLAAAGIAVVLRWRLDFGLVMALPVLTAAALAALRIVPMTGRLVLWVVPLLFLAVAFAVDAGVKSSRRAIRWGTAAVAIPLVLPLSIGVFNAFEAEKTDDRAAIHFMQSNARPGDLFVFVTSATRAAQWYDPAETLRPMRAAVSVPSAADCSAGSLARAATGHRRIIAYAGVRYAPYLNTSALLEQELRAIGYVVREQRFGTEGTVWIVEMKGVTSLWIPAPDECLVVR